MSHVFTLTLTDSHVPRWFTEGLAVHEETAVSPEWGDRLAPPSSWPSRTRSYCRLRSWTAASCIPPDPCRWW